MIAGELKNFRMPSLTASGEGSSTTRPVPRPSTVALSDPVSVTKAEKLRPILGRLNTLKPNRMEAELLSGVRITDEGSMHLASEKLLETGLHRVFLSLGAKGG